jgi:hypothetical protein
MQKAGRKLGAVLRQRWLGIIMIISIVFLPPRFKKLTKALKTAKYGLKITRRAKKLSAN